MKSKNWRKNPSIWGLVVADPGKRLVGHILISPEAQAAQEPHSITGLIATS